MNEIWKDIEGYEGLYQVSNTGNVRSLNWRHTKQIRLLKPQYNNGYFFVDLCKDGQVTHCRIHRLVARAFIPNPDRLEYVNHKDENKTNNNMENLEWCTASYNNTYNGRAKKIGLKVAATNTNGKKSKCVAQCTKDGAVIKIWPSMNEAKRHGFSDASIWLCCIGRYKQYNGYLWRYA